MEQSIALLILAISLVSFMVLKQVFVSPTADSFVVPIISWVISLFQLIFKLSTLLLRLVHLKIQC